MLSFALATQLIHINVKQPIKGKQASTHPDPIPTLILHHDVITAEDQVPSVNTPILVTIESGAQIELIEVFSGAVQCVSNSSTALSNADSSPKTAQSYLYNQTTSILQSTNSQCKHTRVLLHDDAGHPIALAWPWRCLVRRLFCPWWMMSM